MHGIPKDDKKYMSVPKGFKTFNSKDEVLVLNGTLYCFNEAAMGFGKIC